jgi:membrane protease YdiL (CAAX protease family)
MAWLLLVFFLTGAAFGVPLQAAVFAFPAGRPALNFVGLLAACMTALGCYALAVLLGERRAPVELALRPALPGLAVGSGLGLLTMVVLMGVMVATGLYDLTLVGAPPAWTGLGLALQAAVTEELWMRALLLRLLWRAFGPLPAFAVAALVFGALHFANPGRHRTRRCRRGLAGLMFCALYALTGLKGGLAGSAHYPAMATSSSTGRSTSTRNSTEPLRRHDHPNRRVTSLQQDGDAEEVDKIPRIRAHNDLGAALRGAAPRYPPTGMWLTPFRPTSCASRI